MRNALVESQTKWTNFALDIIMMSKQLSHHIDQTAVADIPSIKAKIQEYEKFLLNNEDSNNSSFGGPTGESDSGPIDFSAIRRDLLVGNNDVRKCAILHALRKRLNVTPLQRKLEIMDSMIASDVLGFKDTLFSSMMLEGNRQILDQATRILNVVSSEYRGRTYLLLDKTLIPTMVQLIKNEKGDNIIVQNTIAVLQKFSLRNLPQTLMIEMKMIEWLLQTLSTNMNLTEYTLQYSTALLMNLSLRTAGKDVFEVMNTVALQILDKLLGHEDYQVRSYVNGIFYSILSRHSLKEHAKNMGLEEKLESMKESLEAEDRKQIEYILDQMNCEYEDSCCSDENDNDNEDIDLTGVEESEIMSEDETFEDFMNIPGVLYGDDLLNKEYGLAAISPSPLPLQSSPSPIEFLMPYDEVNVKDSNEGIPLPSTRDSARKVLSPVFVKRNDEEAK